MRNGNKWQCDKCEQTTTIGYIKGDIPPDVTLIYLRFDCPYCSHRAEEAITKADWLIYKVTGEWGGVVGGELNDLEGDHHELRPDDPFL